MKHTAILLAILLTISITFCVFYALCSIIFISKHQEKLPFLKYGFFAAENEKTLHFLFSGFSLNISESS